LQRKERRKVNKMNTDMLGDAVNSELEHLAGEKEMQLVK
jgi:hypothetical protein